MKLISSDNLSELTLRLDEDASYVHRIIPDAASVGYESVLAIGWGSDVLALCVLPK